jgi:hypothetical protein
MISIMDFLPTFARIVGGQMPTDRPIDGMDQTDVLLGNSATGHRESLLSFIGGDLVAARWKQWRIYFTDIHPTGSGPQRQPGIFSASAPMAGYPKVYNIEMDPHEDLVVGGLFGWVSGPALKTVEEYLESVKKTPKPACAKYYTIWWWLTEASLDRLIWQIQVGRPMRVWCFRRADAPATGTSRERPLSTRLALLRPPGDSWLGAEWVERHSLLERLLLV